jgi:hypothetical protein
VASSQSLASLRERTSCDDGDFLFVVAFLALRREGKQWLSLRRETFVSTRSYRRFATSFSRAHTVNSPFGFVVVAPFA